MGAWGLSLGVLHCLGVYLQLSYGNRHNTADALFTETPHDVSAHPGEDVEMACSFRGSGDIPYSLEIQWWYTRNHRDWANKETWAESQLKSLPGTLEKGATKISVVKVFGSNISHKLRLSNVKTSDEGTYECRVMDYSDGKGRQHRVKAFLRVEQEIGRRVTNPHRMQDTGTHRHFPGKELKKRAAVPCEQCQL
ncbi:V-set and transmembrane domain-containing protein 2-like protein [Bombina bombina]|uniref:V-set and transmembrane domain-containing protein 2-like protein n=1 Tax=Bombina bombina TaxID=8345 RepID=UPI00235A81F8|nr:V-set and transmembrane domain-containing protein 2-like protein [Bombina bombina]